MQTEFRFDGVTYDADEDCNRLTGQLLKVYDVMASGNWFTLQEIADIIDVNVASISSRLRDLRKERFGGHTVNRRSRGERKGGLFEYQLEINWRA